MSNINILINTIPYLPDIYTKDNIYKSTDAVDNNTLISADQTIFIFNISSKYGNQYNDPGYLLYGIKNSNYNEYLFPSLYFFNNLLNENLLGTQPYTILSQTNLISEENQTLLNQIGYDVNKIETSNFTYSIINCVDLISNTTRTIIYFYFNVLELNEININNYYSSIYNNKKYYNILIYPYINTDNIINGLNKNVNINYKYLNNNSISKNMLESVKFDDRELIIYLDKLDYKYMERREVMLDQNNSIQIMNAYAKNVKNYEYYLNKNNKPNTIMIDNNEINKLYFNNIDYEINYQNTYTLINLNNNHLNNYTQFSNSEKKYSLTMDSKFGNIYKTPSNRYSCYDYKIINIPSIYQLTKNYHVNTYIDITKQQNDQYKNNFFYITDCYLYKLLLLIDPKIISYDYLASDNIKLEISNLYKDNNSLSFGTGIKKINIYLVEKEFNFTNTFYINKYKIVYSILSNEKKSNYNVIIILSIFFYNGHNINILNKDITNTSDSLAFVSYTNQDCTVTLSPNIYNLDINDIIIIENSINFQLFDIKIYYYKINYSNISKYKKSNNYYNVYNFYFFISNFIPKLLVYDNNNYNNIANNVYNIVINKINNLIKNIINLSIKIVNFISDVEINADILINSIVYDTNISDKLIYNYSYFPKIELLSNFPNTINKYILKNQYNKLIILPSGYYKVFCFTNYSPLNNFLVVNNINDTIVKNINYIADFLNYNFCLLIGLPNDIYVDDKFYVDNYNKNYFFDGNYSYNIGCNNTRIFLVISNSNNEIYVNTQQVIYGLELFCNNKNPNDNYKIKTNLLINNYLNFYQMIFFTEVYYKYNEKNNLILNIDDLFLKLHDYSESKKLLKDIVLFDFYRFNYNCDLNNIIKLSNNCDYTYYYNKYYLSKTKINLKKLIFIFNCIKNLNSVNKILSYLKQIKNNYLVNNKNNYYYIELILYNIYICKTIANVNKELNITYSSFNFYILDIYSSFNTLNDQTTLEEIIVFIKNSEYVKNYVNLKLYLMGFQLLSCINDFNNDIYKDTINKINIEMFNFANSIFINNEIIETLIVKNDNLFNNICLSSIKNKLINYDEISISIILNSIINYLNIITLTSNKIDELYNLVKLIYRDNYTFDEPLLVIKNDYIYDTEYYNNILLINNFNYINFLSDIKTVIIYFSDPINSSTNSILYQKSINEGIIDYINNTINYFSEINKLIIRIYKFIYNINDGILTKLDIYNEENIANFYFIISEFSLNYKKMTEIIINNKIDIFEEFNLTIIFFDNFVSNVKEYLLSVQLNIDFKNVFNNLSLCTPYLFEDVTKILNLDEIYHTVNGQLCTIDKLLINSEPEIINDFIEIINKNYKNNFYDLNYIKKEISLINFNSYFVLKNFIINSFINSNKIYKVELYYNQLITYNDYNIVQFDIDDFIFNFNKKLFEIIVNYDEINQTIFDYYFDDNSNDFNKQLINYNYITNQFVYINIDNIN